MLPRPQNFGVPTGPLIRMSTRVHSTERMHQMWNAFDARGILGLTDSLYVYAQENLENNYCKAGANIIYNDSKGAHEVPILLARLHPEVIKGLISNQLPKKYKSSVRIRNLAYTRDNSPFTYANAVVLKGTDGDFLSPNELRRVIEKMEYYIDHLDDDETDGFCHEVDLAYSIYDEPTHGQFNWRDPATFFDMLRRRCKVDANGNTFGGNDRQHQALMHIGYTMNLDKRLKEHSISKVTSCSSTKTFGLFVSVCKVLGFELENVGIPLIPLTDNEHRSLAEVLCHWLAGSMQDVGGYNIGQPHVKQADLDDAAFDGNIQKLLKEDSGFKTSLEALQNDVEQRIKTLEYCQQDNLNTNLERANEIENWLEEHADLPQPSETLADAYNTGAYLLEQKTRDLSKWEDVLQENEHMLEQDEKFAQMMQQWLG